MVIVDGVDVGDGGGGAETVVVDDDAGAVDVGAVVGGDGAGSLGVRPADAGDGVGVDGDFDGSLFLFVLLPCLTLAFCCCFTRLSCSSVLFLLRFRSSMHCASNSFPVKVSNLLL